MVELVTKFVILEKSEIKGRPGMVLIPSKKNPRVKRWTQMRLQAEDGKEPWEFTHDDLLDVPQRKFPRGAYRGEVHDSKGNYVGNAYLFEGRIYIGLPREFGRGEVTKMLPGSFDPKSFERVGGVQLTASQSVKYWKLKKPKAETTKESYGKRPEVIASGIDIRYREELRKYGYVSILGQIVNTPKQLADLCKIYRNDSFEVFRIFMLDDNNKCLGITAISSHRATQTEVYPETDLGYFKQRMKAIGATKYYVQHNHPNGMVEESPADRQFTKDYAKRLPGFQGSIIIDHNKYCMLGKNGQRVYITLTAEKPLSEDPLEKRKFKVHPALGTTIANADNIFNICKDYHLKKDGYYVLLTRKNMKVTGLVEIPKEFFLDRETAEKAVFKYSLFGGGESFIWGASRSDPIMKKLMIDGVVRDVISEHGVSYYGSMDTNLIESGRSIRTRVYTKEEYVQKAMMRWKDIFSI